MKIIKKPVIPPQTCRNCGAVVQITVKDLKRSGLCIEKIYWQCKLCKTISSVEFKKKLK